MEVEGEAGVRTTLRTVLQNPQGKNSDTWPGAKGTDLCKARQLSISSIELVGELLYCLSGQGISPQSCLPPKLMKNQPHKLDDVACQVHVKKPCAACLTANVA